VVDDLAGGRYSDPHAHQHQGGWKSEAIVIFIIPFAVFLTYFAYEHVGFKNH
jgi:hypothetical protein